MDSISLQEPPIKSYEHHIEIFQRSDFSLSNFKTSNWSKNQILATETSENITSKNGLISLQEPLIKNYEHFIEIYQKSDFSRRNFLIIFWSPETSKQNNLQKWNQFCSRSPQSKVRSILLKFSRDRILAYETLKQFIGQKIAYQALKLQKHITSKN